MIHQRIGMTIIVAVFFAFAAGLHTEETGVPTPKAWAEPAKTVSFPADRWMGNLYVEPESGPGNVGLLCNSNACLPRI